ncbi:nucleotide exchange factor GrpE [Bacteriovorax stolpii]|uniref:Protein GrpE n=1 Tax=Bacteriovorax stolpii TaxID=960 RepID=A0A2K9NWG7_BACTC|nr:nucleotide exchange factor GrpE [Bacteriovorax stolpii]AUN99862.1 nucleotide exchange factor GrpE [Bacteriovorax stolpii]QDK40145.1 nucleotide exchange factor GrpE [Bacteriovorax stolpii]TDP54245.1 molecular chaperone GrpE [Bacteriovorax stolpii]BDT30048.1 nucleotide exchange factor GrpE [Bacteriovorax sp. HI3]
MTENTNDTNSEEILNADGNEATTENVESIGAANAKAGEDFKAKYYYLAAEFENTRKRFEREKENLLKYGSEKILSNLINVVDNFDLTVAALKNDNDDKVQNIVKGIEMIRTQFLDVLKQNGLTQVESMGKVFDPNFHEAVAQAPAPGKEDQEVITEYQKGYVLNGRLLRAAKVVVANNA